MKRSRRSDSRGTDSRGSDSRRSTSRRSNSVRGDPRNAPSPSPDRWESCNGSLTNGGLRSRQSGSLASLVLEGEELTYMMRMREILFAFPNKGPPDEPTQLCPHVFIGSQNNAYDHALLRRLGITHVVNMCAKSQLTLHLNPYPRVTGIFRYVAFTADDNLSYDILQHLPEVLDFLEHCKRNKGRALVHCNRGINRSGAICAAYLMLDQQMPLLKVCELLKKKRSVVLSNRNFRKHLVLFARTHNLLDPVIEPRANYLERCGSVATLPGYTEYSTDVTPGELGTSRPIHSRGHHRSQSMSSGRMYKPMSPGLGSSFPAIQETHSAPTTPTRNHPVYCTLPRATQQASNKRAIAASHYDQDYFMDTIPEDHHQNNQQGAARGQEVFTPPARHYLTKLDRSTKDKDKDKKKGKKKPPEEDYSDWVVSSTRPLRIYKRASTDSLLYQKPTAAHTYRRADTVATTDLAAGMDNMSLQEGKLTQKHRSSSRTSLSSIGSGFFNKLRSRSRMSLQNF